MKSPRSEADKGNAVFGRRETGPENGGATASAEVAKPTPKELESKAHEEEKRGGRDPHAWV